MDTNLLHTLAAVVREGSFERAARLLHITPSAVSQRIRLLEERVGGVLIVRGQPCIPTETAARLCRHAETVAMLEQDLYKDLPILMPQQHKDKATVRVAVNADTLDTWFIHAIARYNEHSSTYVHLAIDDQDQTSEWLRRGQVMAAVTAQAKAVQGCRVHKLGVLDYRATASPTFMHKWFAHGVNIESLRAAPRLVFGYNDRLQERWVRRLLRRDITLHGHLLPSSNAFVQATLQGLGWGMNPIQLVQAHLQSGRLVELIPKSTLLVPLYWQVARLPVSDLTLLTQCVTQTAQDMLQSA